MEVISVFIIASITLLTMVALIVIVARNIIKVPPSTVAVITGRKRMLRNPDTGETEVVGFRIVKGGSAVRLPMIERVDYLPLSVQPFRFKVDAVATRDGAPITFGVVANVRIDSDDASLALAVERLLDLTELQRNEVIGQTLESCLRSIVATMTAAEIDAGAQSLTDRVLAESTTDLARLGVVIDLLTIQRLDS